MHRGQVAILPIVTIVFIVLGKRVLGKATEDSNSSFFICKSKCNLQQGTCQENGECVCFQGWEGETCDRCSLPVGCVHGACGWPGECRCEDGYGGRHCQLDLQYCQRHKPCLNGATCTNDGTGSYVCVCASGYTGVNCDVTLRPLSELPTPLCLNGGTCQITNDAGDCESCLCPEDFAGYRCKRPVHLCAFRPCANGGSCTNLPGGFRCMCVGGYRGPLCDEDVDECETLGHNACLNGGVCVNCRGSYRCTCPERFQGSRCGKRVVRFTTTTRQGLSVTLKLLSTKQNSKPKTNSIFNLENSLSSKVSDEEEKSPKSSTISTPGSVASQTEREAKVIVKQVIHNNVLVPVPENDNSSIVQGVTFALLGAAFVLFVGIGAFVWFYCRSKSLRNNCCVKVNETTNRITEEQDRRTSYLLEHEMNEKTLIDVELFATNRRAPHRASSITSHSGLVSTNSRPSSGEFVQVALPHVAPLPTVRSLVTDMPAHLSMLQN